MKIYKRNFNPEKTILYIRIITLLLISFFIQKAFSQPLNNISPNKSIISPDYSNLYYWAAHPWKKDNSDSVPTEMIQTYENDSTVDVFFIHPTTYTVKSFKEWNASINDEALNIKTDNSAILYQASVFNGSCRVFAPRYRQAHINSYYIDPKISVAYFDTAYEDVKDAFEYYLEHYNNGRPIIIASHSQGTTHAGRLLKEFFENKPLYKKLVCAYVIGMPIPENYFTSIPPCKDSNQTGCFVGWRTFKYGYNPEFVKKETFKSIVVNPLTWTLNDSIASSKLNKGGVLKNFNKIIPGVVNAKVHHNILWSTKPDVFGKLLFFKKNFHIGDINLFYLNIRENVKNRVDMYWKSL